MSNRESLLDAAYDAVVAGRWPQVRMADVAADARVSRQTLYNEFGSKDALCQALALREAGRFLAGTQSTMEAHRGSPAAAIGAAVSWGLAAAGDNPLVKAVLTDDAAGLLPFVTTRAEPVLDSARDGIATFLTARCPGLEPARAGQVADVAVRLTHSYLILPTEPPSASAARVAHVMERLLEDVEPGPSAYGRVTSYRLSSRLQRRGRA